MSVVAYHFWSPTCQPCKVIKPAIEDLKEEFPDVKWVSVNTHEDGTGYSDIYGVRVVPTIVVAVKDATGKDVSVEKHSGTQMAAYYRIIRHALNSSKC
jgi:thiol-disulfide isomerase/thioredoxin